MAVTVPPAVPIGWDPSVDELVVPHPTLFDLCDLSPKPTSPPQAGPPADRVAQLARCVVEVLGGQRPAAQLARWTTEAVQGDLALAVRRAPGPPLRIVSLHRDHSVPDVVEVALHVQIGPRSVAMAFRLERQFRTWICTAWQHDPRDLANLPRRRSRVRS